MKLSEIEQLLPAVLQRTAREGTPLLSLLDVMEALHVPAEAALRDLDSNFSPYRAPDRFVPYLASWLDLQRILNLTEADYSAGQLVHSAFSPGIGHLRELVAAAAQLSRLRGTAGGLVLFLETATGIAGFQIQEDPPNAEGLPRPFYLLVQAPMAARPHERLIRTIVGLEKPAYVTYELEFLA